MTVKNISLSASFCVMRFDLYKSAVTLAPMGYPPKSPNKIGINPSGVILKIFKVALPKNSEIRVNAFEDAIYEDKTRKGKSDGITVESKSVIPFFMPSLAVFGFMIITIIRINVHKIFGKCKSKFLKCIFRNITTHSNIFYEM